MMTRRSPAANFDAMIQEYIRVINEQNKYEYIDTAVCVCVVAAVL